MNMRATLLGILARSMVMASSSPMLSWPTTLSPLCSTPKSEWFSPSTAPITCPSLSQNTASASMSTSSTWEGDNEPPMPTNIRFSTASAGKVATEPLSMTKEIFWNAGAVGISARMTSPIQGSMMSTKWDPNSAGSSISLKAQPPSLVRFTRPTTSAFATLLSMLKTCSRFRVVPSISTTRPFCTSFRRLPFEKAHTTKMAPQISSGTCASEIQTDSSTPSDAPLETSPECVIDPFMEVRLL
mmetsp:Transcript_75608/g.197157  ORF Transcript_75608/g.197157 Transcript_75608/m.197157 type:complete len:242 (+) Transcript_75608:2-727(+)